MAINAAANKNKSDTDSPRIRIEITAPRNGGVEKHAPTRAFPSPRRARTNNTKLTPYPRKPTRSIGPSVVTVRAKVEHPLRVIKRQFGNTKVRYRGRMKNTAQQTTLFALSNLKMRKRLLVAEVVRL